MGEQQGNRSDTDSLSPIVAKQFTDKKGAAGKNIKKGQSIVFTLFMTIAVLGWFGFLVQNTNKKEVLHDAGRAINGLKESFFDQFWHCSLKGENLLDMRSKGDLISRIQQRANAEPVVYGNTVKENCIVYLEHLSVQLGRLDTPIQFQKPVTQIVDSTRQLNSAWNSYIDYLIDPKTKYEHRRVRPILNKIAVGWYKFTNAHNQINRFLLEKL